MIESIISPPAEQEAETPAPDLSVVIVSWNVHELLVRCLDALHTSGVRGGLGMEVIVVDNASTDGSAAAVESYSGVQLVRSGTNLGYGRGNNIGLEAARGRYLLVLNPDAIPRPGSLETLVSFADEHPRAGIVAPRLLNPDGSVQPSAFRFPTLLMAALDLFPLPRIVPGRVRAWVWRSPLNGRYRGEAARTKPFRIDHPLGACLLVRREAYRQVGGFDPNLFMYSEEVDLALRYADTGWECWQVPAARVVHLGGQSIRQVPDRMFVELWRSRLYVYDKHYTLPARLGLRLLLLAAQARDAPVTLAKLLLGRVTRREALRAWARSLALARLVVAR